MSNGFAVYSQLARYLRFVLVVSLSLFLVLLLSSAVSAVPAGCEAIDSCTKIEDSGG